MIIPQDPYPRFDETKEPRMLKWKPWTWQPNWISQWILPVMWQKKSDCVRSFLQSFNTPKNYFKINSVFMSCFFWMGGPLLKRYFRLTLGVNWILNRWYAVESYQGPVPKSLLDGIEWCWVARWHSQVRQMADWRDMSPLHVSLLHDVFQN